MNTLYESILSSTNAGIAGIKLRIETFLKDHNVTRYKVFDDPKGGICVSVIGSTLIIDGDDDKISNISKLYGDIIIKNCTSIPDMPDYIEGAVVIADTEVRDMNNLSSEIKGTLCFYQCRIDSLTGLNRCKVNTIYIGSNTPHFDDKEMKRYTKADKVYVWGVPDTYASAVKMSSHNTFNFYNSLRLNDNDIDSLKPIVDKMKSRLERECNGVKKVSVDINPRMCDVSVRLEYLDNAPHGISDNGVFLDFRMSLEEMKVLLYRTGHIELTDADRKGKYRYFALKSFLDPYLDNGGKKFRTSALKDFDKTTSSIISYANEVYDAAVKDQGGAIERR